MSHDDLLRVSNDPNQRRAVTPSSNRNRNPRSFILDASNSTSEWTEVDVTAGSDHSCARFFSSSARRFTTRA